jgi:hypothetical protein
VKALQLALNLGAEYLVLTAAFPQRAAHGLGVYGPDHIVDGLNAHFYPAVTFAQQLDGILFDHKN